MVTCYVYALVDPNTEVIRYIGVTRYPIQRKYNHRRETTNKEKYQWYRDLKDQGKEPVFKILKECTNEGDEWRYWEKKYVEDERKNGNVLFNKQVGGGGSLRIPRVPIRMTISVNPEEWGFIQKYKLEDGISELDFISEAIKKKIADRRAEEFIKDHRDILEFPFSIFINRKGVWSDFYPQHNFTEERAKATLKMLEDVYPQASDNKCFKVGLKLIDIEDKIIFELKN